MRSCALFVSPVHPTTHRTDPRSKPCLICGPSLDALGGHRLEQRQCLRNLMCHLVAACTLVFPFEAVVIPDDGSWRALLLFIVGTFCLCLLQFLPCLVFEANFAAQQTSKLKGTKRTCSRQARGSVCLTALRWWALWPPFWPSALCRALGWRYRRTCSLSLKCMHKSSCFYLPTGQWSYKQFVRPMHLASYTGSAGRCVTPGPSEGSFRIATSPSPNFPSALCGNRQVDALKYIRSPATPQKASHVGRLLRSPAWAFPPLERRQLAIASGWGP